ncbi:hypothetical protein J3R83DRAFT_9100 [Lanmaoa asiatica]|nr:hypothetical protein J3R83DRAFT_9100 [Lanmaoa asiatica]
MQEAEEQGQQNCVIPAILEPHDTQRYLSNMQCTGGAWPATLLSILTTWLSHSKKKTCDVCKHPYSFTKVYASDMPTSLPPLLLIRRPAQQAFFASLFGIRAVLIGIVWLALLPWITIWTWRVYFTMGESTTWWISGRERPADVQPIGIVPTLMASNDTVSSFKNATILHRFASRAFWQTLSSDIFAGQIIASLIVLIFVAVFLLREWISQNARPGVFEEDEIAGVPPQDPPVPKPPPTNQPVQDANAHLLAPQRQGPPDIDVEARRQARLWRPYRPVLPNPRFEALQRHFDDVERLEHLRDPIRRPQNPRIDTFIETDKGKEKEAVTADSAPTALDVRRRTHRRFDDVDIDETIEHLAEAGPSSFASSSFAPSSPISGDAEIDIREPVPETPARYLRTPIPEEEEAPRRRSIVFSPDLSPRTLSPRAATPAVEDITDLKPSDDSLSSASSDFGFRHLPMSNSSFAAEDGLGFTGLQRPTPSEHSATQSIFTYPSEVLATDSTSLPAENMDRKKRPRDEMEEEFEHYFRNPQPATVNPVDADNDCVNVPHEVAHGAEHAHVADGEERPPLEVDPDEEDDSEDDEAPERILWDADADREDEDDDDDAVDIRDFNVPNRPGAQGQPQLQAPVEQLNDAVDDLEAAVEDDMEGALEAIGLRGPIFGVVQNVILMIFVLDTAIGFGVWLPFTLGKTTALLSLDPQRALYILHLPIRGMRIVTDPFVDFFTLVLGRFLFPFFHKTSRFFLSNVLSLITYFTGSLALQSAASSQSHDITSWVASKRSELSAVASLWLQSPPEARTPHLSQQISNFFESNSTIAQLLEPRFAYVGREVRLFTDHFQQSWIRLTLGHGSNERAFAITLGYGVVGIILALYLNVFTVGNARTAGRAVRNAVRQQLLVVKVCTDWSASVRIRFPLESVPKIRHRARTQGATIATTASPHPNLCRRLTLPGSKELGLSEKPDCYSAYNMILQAERLAVQ